MYLPSRYPKEDWSAEGVLRWHKRTVEEMERVLSIFGIKYVVGEYEIKEDEQYYEVSFSNSELELNEEQRNCINDFMQICKERVSNEKLISKGEPK